MKKDFLVDLDLQTHVSREGEQNLAFPGQSPLGEVFRVRPQMIAQSDGKGEALEK